MKECEKKTEKKIWGLLAMICLVAVFVGVKLYLGRCYLRQEEKYQEETAEKIAGGTYCTVKSNSLDGVPIYDKPGEGEQIALIPEGKCCQLLKKTKDEGKMWAQVDYCGLTGWLKMKQLLYLSKADVYIKKGTMIYMNSLTEKGISGFSEAGGQSEEIVRGIRYGDEFTVEKLKEGWAQVAWKDKQCWINMYHMGSYPSGQWKVETLSAVGQINLREEPGEDERMLCKIPENTLLTLTEFVKGWGKTVYDGKTGWVMLHYLTPIKAS